MRAAITRDIRRLVNLTRPPAATSMAAAGAVLAALLAAAPVTALADTEVAPAGPDIRVDVGLGRFSGDYGLEESTTVDVLNFSARRFLPRGELQVSVPFLRIDGPADVRFISGQPASGPGARPQDPAPGGPPAGPPGDGETVLESRTETGLGDVMLQGEYYLMTGTAERPWVIGLLRAKLPTGSEERGLGTGKMDLEAGVGLIQRFGTIDVLADAGYTWVGSPSDYDLRDVFRLGVGASHSFGPDDRHNGYVYLENRTNTVRGLSDRVSLAFGAGTALGEQMRTRLSASLFLGLSSTAEDVGLYVMAGHHF